MNRHNKIMKFCVDKDGYKKLELHCNGKGKEHKLHRLLAIQYIPNPFNYLTVDHINRNRTDNRLENLRWASNFQQTHNQSNNTKHINIRSNRGSSYEVRIMVNGEKKYIGCYKTLEAAMSERDCAIDFYGLPNYCYGLEPINNYV